jgi:hypothetical protein
MQIIETEKASTRVNNCIQIGYILNSTLTKEYNATIIKYPHYRYIPVTQGQTKEQIIKKAIAVYKHLETLNY